MVDTDYGMKAVGAVRMVREGGNEEDSAKVYVPVDGGFKKAAVHWLFGQPANTIALYLILCAIGYVSWYVMTTGIPAHLKQIQSGYDQAIEKGREARKEDRESHTKELLGLQTTFEKAIDRHEKAFTEGYNAAVKRGTGN